MNGTAVFQSVIFIRSLATRSKTYMYAIMTLQYAGYNLKCCQINFRKPFIHPPPDQNNFR